MARMLGRRTAKAAYWLAGKLSRIQTTQTVYELVSWEPIKFEPAGKHKGSCGLTYKVLGWSERLDLQHWDHWALKHDDCAGHRCEECGGVECPPVVEEEDA